jgi:addiction module antitoxin, relB/dinJ family
MNALIQFRVDKELKNEADKLFKELGLDLGTAIKLFLKQSVNKQAIPFAITAQKDEIDAKYLKSVIENIDGGKVKMIRKNLGELESLADA